MIIYHNSLDKIKDDFSKRRFDLDLEDVYTLTNDFKIYKGDLSNSPKSQMVSFLFNFFK